MKLFRSNILLVVFIGMLGGCVSHPQTVLNPKEREEMGIKTIAVLPVENKASRDKTAQLLRSRLFEEIYFKGYSKISLQEIDGNLRYLNENSDQGNISVQAPERLKDVLKADALLHCTLSEKNKSGFFYAPLEINVVCTLRRADNGKMIWQAKSDVRNNNFDITPKRLEKKISEDYDILIDQVVDEIMKSLPDGPNFQS